MNQSQKLTISVKELAAALGISPSKAYHLVRRSDFPSIHLGGRWLIPIYALERWLVQQSEQQWNCPFQKEGTQEERVTTNQ